MMDYSAIILYCVGGLKDRCVLLAVKYYHSPLV